jgi:hypothetical protein
MTKFKKGVKYVFSGKAKAPNNVVCMQAFKARMVANLVDQPEPIERTALGLTWKIPDHEPDPKGAS